MSYTRAVWFRKSILFHTKEGVDVVLLAREGVWRCLEKVGRAILSIVSSNIRMDFPSMRRITGTLRVSPAISFPVCTAAFTLVIRHYVTSLSKLCLVCLLPLQVMPGKTPLQVSHSPLTDYEN